MRGRIRTFKPELFDDEELWDLAAETGLPVFQCFLGLWSYADREARFEWRPRALKKHILPYWDGDIAVVLEALASKSFIVRYTVDGKDYGYVRTLKAHQSFNAKEPPSELPPPSDHAKVTREPPVTHPSTTGERIPPTGHVWNGTEGNGKGMGVGTSRGDEHARIAATALHRERDEPPSHSRPARVYTMPGAEPPREYLDGAVMAGLSREQATSTWEHYWAEGLPERGVEKLHAWLLKRAKERAAATAKVPRAGPTDALQRAADRVTRLREQEAAEERQRAAGGNG